VLPVVHFAATLTLIVLRYTTYYETSFTLEPLMNLMVLPAGWLIPVLRGHIDLRIPLLILNSVLWGVLAATLVRCICGWRLTRVRGT